MVHLSAVESERIDEVLEQEDEEFRYDSKNSGLMENYVSSIYVEPEALHSKLQDSVQDSKFACSIGATVPDLESDSDDDDDSIDDNSTSTVDEDDLDDAFVSATSARVRKDIDAKHLSKIWRIDLDVAQRTLDVTTQKRGISPQVIGVSVIVELTNTSLWTRSLRLRRLESL